jgi:peptide-methionine (S)-S-oxide reductase
VLRTRAGYCGGTAEDPTYRSIGDHTEAVSVDYDPAEIDYEDLLKYFWGAHDCRSGSFGRQYRQAVFSRNDEQREIAEKSRQDHAEARGISSEAVQTRVVPIDRFTIAEGYHQKYRLRAGSALRSFLEQTYPDFQAFVDSSVAMRVNSVLSSASAEDWQIVEAELVSYGLPAELEASLRKKR